MIVDLQRLSLCVIHIHIIYICVYLYICIYASTSCLRSESAQLIQDSPRTGSPPMALGGQESCFLVAPGSSQNGYEFSSASVAHSPAWLEAKQAVRTFA